MDKLRERFTKWYYRKGYRMAYKPCDYADGVAELMFFCPWYISILASVLFSPGIYYKEVGNSVADEFMKNY